MDEYLGMKGMIRKECGLEKHINIEPMEATQFFCQGKYEWTMLTQKMNFKFLLKEHIIKSSCIIRS